ncbi:MAG TPA: malto-oligosyltrehalose trehalohydrolase [Rubrivivax sp.]|nr:malto-oligosyltrehalose trehalohydrolase [Rubrivivax sp.]
MKAAHTMRFGAEVLDGGGVRFALWAPSAAQVQVQRVAAGGGGLERHALQRDGEGWHEGVWPEAAAGMLYRFELASGQAVPDPASRCNPQGVHGPSRVIDPRDYAWGDAGWTGRPWHEAVIYELHLGCFTPEGSFDAAALRLPYLRELGITALQLMPLAAFSGRRGWGYDGVLPFAPHPAYGTPRQLKRFIDRAHRLGLMVLLDVVYNHFGPDGNYLYGACPEFYAAAQHTPWGPAFDYGREPVRRFFVDNALYWVSEYRVDGLRLDAVHAIRDAPAAHLVDDIAAALRDGPGRERELHLVLENDDNRARWLARDGAGRPRVARAQWNDDWHHAAHVLASGEREGYYRDYADAPVARLARALAEGFVYQGEPSAHRGGRPRGEPSAALPAQAFVAFLQNHDQVGNRAGGERLDALSSAARIELLLACLLLAPHVPLLFMGEEFAASTPFLYFCDFDGELAAAVRRGRRQEFAAFAAFADAAARERIADPNAEASFAASRLRWEERDSRRGRRRLALVQQLLALRREHLLPHLPALRRGGVARSSESGFRVDWPLGDGWHWTMRARFGAPAGHWPLAAGESVVYRAGAVAAAGAAGEQADQVLVTQRRDTA